MDTARKKKNSRNLSELRNCVSSRDAETHLTRAHHGQMMANVYTFLRKNHQKKTSILLKPETSLKVPKLPKIPKFAIAMGKHPLDEKPYSTRSWSPRKHCPNAVLGLLTRSYKMGTAGLPTCKKGCESAKKLQRNAWMPMVPKQHLKGPQAQVFIWRSYTFLMFFSRRTEMITTRMKFNAQTLMKSKILRFEFWTPRIGVPWFCPRNAGNIWVLAALTSLNMFEVLTTTTAMPRSRHLRENAANFHGWCNLKANRAAGFGNSILGSKGRGPRNMIPTALKTTNTEISLTNWVKVWNLIHFYQSGKILQKSDITGTIGESMSPRTCHQDLIQVEDLIQKFNDCGLLQEFPSFSRRENDYEK